MSCRSSTGSPGDGLRRRPLGFPQRASTSLRHRLPDAGQRSRSRGHCARHLGTLADGRSKPGSGCRSISRDDGDAIGDQRHAVGALAPGNIRWVLAAGTGGHSAEPGLGAERSEALDWGSCVLLERLTPTERAAYILREAFDYTYRDIANVLRLEEANARQVVTRARQHVANGRRTSANSTEQRRLLEAVSGAVRSGDIAALEGFLVSNVASTSDGVGMARWLDSLSAVVAA